MLLEWKNVTGTGKGFQLKEISFSIEPGYLIGLAGKNGAGKTTLFHYMLEEKKRYVGEIRLDGELLHGNHVKALDKIGYVADDNAFIPAYSLKDNAKMLSLFYTEFDWDLFYESLQRVNLKAGMQYGTMSRGEKLKFQLVFAMAHKTKLYLMDEAIGGMDAIFRREFFRMLRECIKTEEASVLLATHIEEELEEKLDYVYVMEEGRLKPWRV